MLLVKCDTYASFIFIFAYSLINVHNWGVLAFYSELPALQCIIVGIGVWLFTMMALGESTNNTMENMWPCNIVVGKEALWLTVTG